MAIVKLVKVPLVILVVLSATFLFCINISAFSTSHIPLDKGDMLVYQEELVDQGLVYDFEVEHKPIKGYIEFYYIYDKYAKEKLKVGRRKTFHKEKLSSKEEGLRYGFPLKVGLKWDEFDPKRNDNMYCWYVEKMEDVTVPAGVFKDCFKIVYDTCPDTETEWYYPSIGIVKYEYHHHGTITNETKELIKIVRK
ncbi:MAG: hypothetical protein Q8O13_01315 [Candidatus Omnitrophota bacterium]|nr:hypothetical protein [Candidatus Omnitrophota bacterium]